MAAVRQPESVLWWACAEDAAGPEEPPTQFIRSLLSPPELLPQVCYAESWRCGSADDLGEDDEERGRI